MQRITLDYANCLSDRVGAHGISERDLTNAASRMTELTDRLAATRGTGLERWRLLPHEPLRSAHVDPVRELARDLRPRTQNLIVLGIGGSALGNIALQSALNPPTWNLLRHEQRGGPRIFILDNVDPELVHATLDLVEHDDPGFRHTIINVISKSGETAETAAQFLIMRSRLANALGKDYHRNIIAITDPERGTMRSMCDREGYRTLPVPEGVGGRFSVLSPVGLFSAALCGIDIDGLLDGAADMERRCSERETNQNPAALLGWLLVELARRGKPNHVLMPYANSLYLLADWYRQLWAESLGKRVNRKGEEVFAGATPIKALGTTDQHSQVQLYREGPNDKVFGFMEVAQFRSDVEVPGDLDVGPLRYLHGASLTKLLNAEKRATEFALVESERPNFTIHFPQITPRSVGEFIMLWEMATAYAGLLFDIDAYDQPAVETGKQATFGLMGREGYGEWKSKVDETLRETQFIA